MYPTERWLLIRTEVCLFNDPPEFESSSITLKWHVMRRGMFWRWHHVQVNRPRETHCSLFVHVWGCACAPELTGSFHWVFKVELHTTEGAGVTFSYSSNLNRTSALVLWNRVSGCLLPALAFQNKASTWTSYTLRQWSHFLLQFLLAVRFFASFFLKMEHLLIIIFVQLCDWTPKLCI